MEKWAYLNEFTEVALDPIKWSEFTNCAPRLPRVDGLEPDIPCSATSPLPSIGEFRPAPGTFIKCGILTRVNIQPCQIDNAYTFSVVFAQAQSVSEISSIRSLLSPHKHIHVCVVSPSELISESESSHSYWHQRWWLDSCQFGDVLAGTWDIWTHFDFPITIPSYRTASSCLRTLYLEYGFNIAAPDGPTKRRPLEHSVGVEISTPLPGNCIRLT